MHSKRTPFPTIRLTTAGFVSLPLIVWVGHFDDCWQNGLALVVSHRLQPTDEVGGYITIGISLFILAALFPVVLRGASRDRWLALLLAAFPLLLVLLTVIGVLCSAGAVRI